MATEVRREVICFEILLFTESDAILSAITSVRKFGFDKPIGVVSHFLSVPVSDQKVTNNEDYNRQDE